MSQKQSEPAIKIPAEITAEIADCSPSLVRQVRSGGRKAQKGAGAKVAVVDELLYTGVNALIEEVKRVVKL